MATKQIISVEQFCQHYAIDTSFIDSLIDFGLTEITVVEQTPYIHKRSIKDLERMMRLHYDLQINLEGIEAISHLLHRVDNLQDELLRLKNRIRFYEE